MQKKLFFLLLILTLVILPLLAACTQTSSTTSAQPSSSSTSAPSTTSTSPTTSATLTKVHWWDELGVPQYGGTITIPADSFGSQFDAYSFTMGTTPTFCYDTLFDFNWTTDRKDFSFAFAWAPLQYYTGILAESWEQTDSLTVTVHIRKGVHWWNKPPVNGREFTAYDVQYFYDRMLGTGSGFTQASIFASLDFSDIDRVVATDDYTVVFHLKQPGLSSVQQVVGSSFYGMIAPEWIEQYGAK